MRWCPNCRAEYRPFVSECSDCWVPLVDQLPEPEIDHRDHRVSEWELTDWDERQLRSLFRLLDGADVAYEWEAGPNTLRASIQHEATVDELLQVFDDEFTLVEAGETGLESAEAARPYVYEPEIASLGRRASGYVVDTIVNGFVGSLVWFALCGFNTERASDFSSWRRGVVLAVLVVVYETVVVARWGKTVGKVCFETRVVSEATEALPTVGQALRRAALPSVTGFLGLIGLVFSVAIVGAAAFDPLRRGLHDRLAGTIVLYEKRATWTRRR